MEEEAKLQENSEATTPTVEKREQEHNDMTKLVSQYENAGERIATPITVDTDSVKINPFDDTHLQQANEYSQKVEYEWTKHYMDEQFFSASSALRLNSVADLGAQVRMSYDVLMPIQQELAQSQDYYEYLNDQINNSRELSQMAFQQQQAQAVVSIQQLNQRLQLELNESRQNMENQITTMLGVYNQYESSLNDLVLTKSSIKNQQDIIDKRKQGSKKSFWTGFMQALPMMMLVGFAGGKALGAVGNIGGVATKLGTIATSGSKFAGLAKVGGALLKGGTASTTVAGLIGGAASIGAYMNS